MGDAVDWARFPPEMEIEALRARMRCTQCGARAVLLYRGWDVGGFAVGYGGEVSRRRQSPPISSRGAMSSGVPSEESDRFAALRRSAGDRFRL